MRRVVGSFVQSGSNFGAPGGRRARLSVCSLGFPICRRRLPWRGTGVRRRDSSPSCSRGTSRVTLGRAVRPGLSFPLSAWPALSLAVAQPGTSALLTAVSVQNQVSRGTGLDGPAPGPAAGSGAGGGDDGRHVQQVSSAAGMGEPAMGPSGPRTGAAAVKEPSRAGRATPARILFLSIYRCAFTCDTTRLVVNIL